MACRTEETTIDDHAISVTQWNVTTALRLKMRIAKLIGPAMTAMDRVDVDPEDLEAMFAKGIAAVFESDNADPDAIVQLLGDILTSGGVRVGGETLTPAMHTQLFSGDGMALMYQVIFFVLKVNFGDLMTGRFLKGKPTTEQDAPTGLPGTQT